MKERRYLKNSILLCGESDGKKFQRTFKILKKIDAGASVVCYKASHEKSGRGVLKEFYPKDAYSLERREDGQLIHTEGFEAAKEYFQKLEREYINSYEMLLKAKKDGNEKDLETFIPEFEIYHGCDQDGNIVGSTYIWTPEPELETFDQICHEIHGAPEQEPEHKMVLVLSVIETLTKCVCALHNAEMIHRDIKPSNFGFKRRGNETLTQTLSMFDIDSICSVYDVPRGNICSKGYTEPEAGYVRANNQTDIYAIGAILFHAIIVSDEAKENQYLYREEFYETIRERIDSSLLIQACEANSHPRLRHILTRILQKCLAARKNRYECCENLLEDIDEALYYALPSDIANKKHIGQRWVLKDVEKSLDLNQEKNSTLAIQYHLYQNPLYHWEIENNEWFNVMVIGFGNYGQKFLDICLQAGQISGKKLNITVISDDAEDKSVYLSGRPALKEFFHIDGGIENTLESYGNVVFEVLHLSRSNVTKNSKILQNFLFDRYENNSKKIPQYIFIALGDDQLNLKAAKACKTAVNVFGMKSCVNFAVENDNMTIRENGIFPVYVCANMADSSLHAEIERMAFNVHLVWKKDLNLDYKKIRKEFRKPYNYDACVGNVLSIKYKLHHIGIDLEHCSFEEAAGEFVSKCLNTDKTTNAKYNELIYMEHKRWVVEKLCAGWNRITNYEECLDGTIKDERRKRHVCIVRSEANQKLAEEFCENGNHEKWDTAEETALKELDELDRMSVALHRVYAKKAGEVKKENLLNGHIMAGIRKLIQEERKAFVAFQEWFSCLKDIWSGDSEKVKRYQGLKDMFLAELSDMPAEHEKSIKEQIKAFEVLFYPVLAAMEYRDFKQDDVALTDHIPFILTYTSDICLVIPYHSKTDNTERFLNMAAATVINPVHILFLYHVEQQKELLMLEDGIVYISEYMKRKKLRARIEFVLLCTENIAKDLGTDINKKFKELSGERIQKVKVITVLDRGKLSDVLIPYLCTKRMRRKVFALEKNDTDLSVLLRGAGVYEAFNSYTFDSCNLQFTSAVGCEMLQYINKKPYINVEDMAAIRLSSGKSSHQPEFFADYQTLWMRYREENRVWKQLCGILHEYSVNNDLLGIFNKQGRKSDESEKLIYIIPFHCSFTVGRIIHFLKEHDMLEQESRISVYTTDACEVIISDKWGNKKNYDQLFGNIYALMDNEAVRMYLNTKSQAVSIIFDNLVVRNVSLPSDKTELVSLLKFFENMHYIVNFKADNHTVSFTYATRQIKGLLTTEGKMLEVYTYHRIKELGAFDDVVSSYEIDWTNTAIKSKLDCILTKGFKTLFVECKASDEIEQDYYVKLSGLAKEFGINATAVLIDDTEKRSFYDNARADNMQRKSFSMKNITTVWKPDEIENIGNTLMKIIEEN